MELIIEFLLTKLPLLLHELSSHHYEHAEILLNISNKLQSTFTIYENILSPFLLLILCEINYNEYNFTKYIMNNTTNITLNEAYLHIISDINILMKIFFTSSSTSTTGGGGGGGATAGGEGGGGVTSFSSTSNIQKLNETTSISSSLTSNFSYISLDSMNDEYCHINHSMDEIESKIENNRNYRIPTPIPDHHEELLGPDHRRLLQIFRDILLYLTIRRNLLNLYLSFNIYSPQQTLESHIRFLQLTLLSASPGDSCGETLFNSLRCEISCLLYIFECRSSILKGKFIGIILACEKLRESIITWAEMTQQSLPIIPNIDDPNDLSTSIEHDTSTPQDRTIRSSRDWDCLLGWMCACYRRYLAASQIIFQEKRIKINDLFVEIPSHQQELSTPSLSPRASFITRQRSPTFSISGHGCTLCQSYVHCICPNSDYRCLNHDLTTLISAIDQFYLRGQEYYKELSLTVVALTSDGEFTTRQFICPPRDQWELINHPQTVDNLHNRSRIGSVESLPSLAGSRRSSQDNILGYSNLISPPSIASLRGQSNELVILSKLSPSSAVTGKYQSNSPISTKGTRDRSLSNSKQDLTPSQSSNILQEGGSNPPPPPHGMGRRNSLSQSKLQSNNSANDLSSTSLKPAGRSNSMIHPSGLVPSFAYSHNPLNLHFTSHHIDSSDELESTRKHEIDLIDYESKWLETHLPHLKTIIEYHITRGLQGNSKSFIRNNSNLSQNSSAIPQNINPGGGGVSTIDYEKKRYPLCVPIFDSTHSSHPHSRGYSIIASFPGSTTQSANSFVSMGGSPLIVDQNDYLSSSYPGNGGTNTTGPKSSSNVISRIFLVGVVLDRKVGEVETKHDFVTTQHIDDVGRELSQILRNITEIISGKDLF